LRALQLLRSAAAKTYTAGQAELQLIASHRMTPEDMLLTLRDLVALHEALCYRNAFKVNGKHTNLLYCQKVIRFAKLPIDLVCNIG